MKTYTKLSMSDARLIRRLWKSNNFSMQDIAEIYNTNYETIRHIVINKAWTNKTKIWHPPNNDKALGYGRLQGRLA